MIFFYRCKDENEVKEGYIHASSMANASSKLEKQGYIVLELKKHEDKRNNPSFSSKIAPLDFRERKSFYNTLYEQHKAGISFVEVFNNIISTTASNNIRSICFNITRDLQNGKSFEEIIGSYSYYLNEVYASLMVAGEKSGKLEKILKNISNQLKEEENILISLKTKTTYPKIIFGMLIFALCVFCFFVFPIFNATIESKTVSLFPYVTGAIIKTGIVFCLLGALMFNIKNNIYFKNKVLAFVFKLKPIKEIVKYYRFYNFFVVLFLSYDAGMLPCDGVKLAKQVFLGEYAQKIKKIESMLFDGSNLATAFGVSEIFSNYALSRITTGEQAGELHIALNDIAQDYKKMYLENVGCLLRKVEPMLICIAGVFLLIIATKMFSKYYETLFSLF